MFIDFVACKDNTLRQNADTNNEMHSFQKSEEEKNQPFMISLDEARMAAFEIMESLNKDEYRRTTISMENTLWHILEIENFETKKFLYTCFFF